MEESLKVDKDFIKAFNQGYEVAKELDLKVPMFPKEGSDIRLDSSMQAGMFQYIKERQANVNKSIRTSHTTLKASILKRTLGKNRNKGKGLTP